MKNSIALKAHINHIYNTVQSIKVQIKKYGRENCKDMLGRNGLNGLIRGLDNIIGNTYVSKRALNLIHHPRPFGLNYSFRHKIAEESLQFEHMNTINDMVNHLISEEMSLEETYDYLVLNHKVCWITSEENSRLNKKWKNHRPNGGAEAYKEVGIVYIDDFTV